MFSMTPAMGRDFYGFLEGIFEKKLVGLVEKKLRRQIGTYHFTTLLENYFNRSM